MLLGRFGDGNTTDTILEKDKTVKGPAGDRREVKRQQKNQTKPPISSWHEWQVTSEYLYIFLFKM